MLKLINIYKTNNFIYQDIVENQMKKNKKQKDIQFYSNLNNYTSKIPNPDLYFRHVLNMQRVQPKLQHP